ncbi:venom carboxylesterase-6-like [Anopheles albimanus]|uniref:venom carboxylesterase-6-like n=1 Tax=Anopheles albimanus TaxID=7167 RepID=UPI001640F351|nr:venom carboxylesterase-6-like [Anopheles albimanus]XP_035794846.1 venom carboxylesterase-6-like [Anopheles albimanus]XP_035794847.1 venom carboxylesterase-6-like [Anopheles albimanus]XP_035794848.1 venom carboxylesterase-6-like [Anopheles albimanus]XP_035794849.1 venom carboxylesterase-6-like [Anopheles albimanus]
MSQLITMGWSMLVLFAVTMCGINGQQSSLLRATTPQPNSSCTAKEQLGQDAPRVCIQDGCILGTIMNGMKPAESFEAFLGIPYAAPPIGELRFANPMVNRPWKDVTDYNASHEKPMCLQRNDLLPGSPVSGSEDCLYLNVYRPKVCNDSQQITSLPVMVYIHGGGFFSGTASPLVVGPEYLMDTKRIILVTIQYRLGVLGFLSTGDTAAPGNVGLKDQTLALRWVRHNIRHFGGDPKLVTIFGQSAGATSVHMHMISPLSRNLFQRAITMSGNSLVPWNIPTKDPLRLARATAAVVNIENHDQLSTKALVAKLRAVPGEQLVENNKLLKSWSIDPLTLYRPVVEPKDAPGAFLVEEPKVSWLNGNYQQVPWLVGYVPNEGAVRALAIFKNEQLFRELQSNFSTILPILLERPPSKLMLEKVRARFLNDSSESVPIRSDQLQAFTDLYTEAAFLYPIQLGVKQFTTQTNTNVAPVSVYRFAYKGRYSYSSLFSGGDTGDYGVVHCDDLIYLFRSPAIFPDFPPDSPELKMVDLFVNFFIDFAINGKAKALTPHRECKTGNQVYQSMDCDVQEFHREGDEVQVRAKNERNEDMFAFWKDFY